MVTDSLLSLQWRHHRNSFFIRFFFLTIFLVNLIQLSVSIFSHKCYFRSRFFNTIFSDKRKYRPIVVIFRLSSFQLPFVYSFEYTEVFCR